MSMVVTGAVFVDIKGYPDGPFIEKGRNAGKIEYVHGGVSRNIAEDIANVQLKPTFIGLTDETGAGADVIEKLKSSGVDTSYMRMVPDGMGTWLAVFDEDGDVYAAISKRPDLTEICSILDEHGDEIFSRADSILTELDIEKEILERLMYFAEKYDKPVYSAVTNMSIALQRREYIRKVDLFVCNQQEAGLLFLEDYMDKNPEEMKEILISEVKKAGMKKMIVTMSEKGAVYACADGTSGYCPAEKVRVMDTTGAGDAFFAGACIGLTYGKTMDEACIIGTRLAASVIMTTDNVCPRFIPSEFGIQL